MNKIEWDKNRFRFEHKKDILILYEILLLLASTSRSTSRSNSCKYGHSMHTVCILAS